MYQNPLAGKSLESQRKNTNIATVTQVTVKTKVIKDQGGSTKRNQKKHKKHQDSNESDSDSGKEERGRYTNSKYYVSYKEMM